MASPAEMSSIRSVASIVIPVADQDLALTFYRDTLGLELRADFAPGAASAGSR